jgi:hypothetical protein
MATKFTYKMRSGGKWDVGSGTRPSKQIKIIILIFAVFWVWSCIDQHSFGLLNQNPREPNWNLIPSNRSTLYTHKSFSYKCRTQLFKAEKKFIIRRKKNFFTVKISLPSPAVYWNIPQQKQVFFPLSYPTVWYSIDPAPLIFIQWLKSPRDIWPWGKTVYSKWNESSVFI